MPNAAKRWTADMVRALPEDGNRYEFISGEFVVTPAPRWSHQRVIRELVRRLDPWLQSAGAYELLWSPADISLGEDEVLQPDLFVYRTEAGRPPREWSDISELALVIEVLSPSTARYDRQLKRRRYQRAGIPEYWIVDPDSRLAELWRPNDERPEVISDRIEWRPDQAMPTLSIDLPELFATALGETATSPPHPS